MGGEPVLVGAFCCYICLFFFVLHCLSHLRGGTTAVPWNHRCRPRTKEAAFPSPSSSGIFSRDVLLLSCSFSPLRVFPIVSSSLTRSYSFRLALFSWPGFPFSAVHFPSWFAVVPVGGGVAMIAVRTPLSPIVNEVTDRVANASSRNSEHMSASASSPVVVCLLCLFRSLVQHLVVWFCWNLSFPKSLPCRGTSLSSLRRIHFPPSGYFYLFFWRLFVIRITKNGFFLSLRSLQARRYITRKHYLKR